jgi:hypothetical protein
VSWLTEYNKGHWERGAYFNGKGRQLGNRELHAVKDILNHAADKAQDSDLLVLTNDDTGFAVGITETLLDVAAWPLPAAYAHRLDWDNSCPTILDGETYPGVDLFAIGVKLWKQWRLEFPDCVIGAEQWDLAMLAFMRRVGAPNLAGAIWHQSHAPSWVGFNSVVANNHNRLACGKWFDSQGITADQVINNEL